MPRAPRVKRLEDPAQIEREKRVIILAEQARRAQKEADLIRAIVDKLEVPEGMRAELHKQCLSFRDNFEAITNEPTAAEAIACLKAVAKGFRAAAQSASKASNIFTGNTLTAALAAKIGMGWEG